MWTKLFSEFRQDSDDELDSARSFYDALLTSEFIDSGVHFQRITGGSKSVLYLIDEKWVLKVPLFSSQSKQLFRLELSILEHFYADGPFFLEGMSTALKFSGISFKRLESSVLSAKQAFDLQRKFHTFTPNSGELLRSGVQNRDISELIRQSIHAADYFCQKELFSADFRQSIQLRIDDLDSWLKTQPRVFCHGDFGPQNIYSYNKEFIALDWEDSFFGIQDYDFLYWLTFLSNTKLVSIENLRLSKIPIKRAVDLLFVIILLKEYSMHILGKYNSERISPIERMNTLSKLTELI
jgi:hypothetical protein